MLLGHLLPVVFSISCLRILECAEYKIVDVKIDAANVDISSELVDTQRRTCSSRLEAATQDHCDAFTGYLNEELFHKILEYVAKSPGKMATTSKKLHTYVEKTRFLRFYSGAGWDMPELADIRQSGDSDDEIASEMNIITNLRNVSNEKTFNCLMYSNLIRYRRFKKLSSPVFKYLFRILPFKDQITNDTQLQMIENLYEYAVNNRFYEYFFEMKMHLDLSIQHEIQNRMNLFTFYDYYTWVYDNPRARSQITEISACTRLTSIYTDIQSWASVCIQRKSPESYYVDHLRSSPHLFEIVIEVYLKEYGLITRDAAEMEYYHAFIGSLIDRYLRPNRYLRCLSLIDVLNNVRYGRDDVAEAYQNCIATCALYKDTQTTCLCDFMFAASKANKKELVLALSSHPKFNIRDLGLNVDLSNPQSFKVFFDIIEMNPCQTIDCGGFCKVKSGIYLLLISRNNFKVNSAKSLLPHGIRLEIKSPAEYAELGFAPLYKLSVENERILPSDLSNLKSKMFKDAAAGGKEEFKNFITNLDPFLFRDSHIWGSSKVIQLLENEELIRSIKDQELNITVSPFEMRTRRFK